MAPPTRKAQAGEEAASGETIGRFQAVHDAFIHLDVSATFKDLKNALSLGGNAMDVAALVESTDKAAERYWKAQTLYLQGRKHRAMQKIRCRRRMAELHNKARQEIALAKQANPPTFAGNVTISAIEDWIAVNHGDEWAVVLELEEDVRNIRDSLDALARAWGDRMHTLKLQAQLRERRGPSATRGGR